MTDRRSSTDRQPNLDGMDYVLEGVTVRDRFLTAFVLRHNGTLQGAWPQAASQPAPHSFSINAAFPPAEQGSFRVRIEEACEPLRIGAVDTWLGFDDDDDDK